MSSLYCDALGILSTALGGTSDFEKIHDQDSEHQASQSHMGNLIKIAVSGGQGFGLISYY